MDDFTTPRREASSDDQSSMAPAVKSVLGSVFVLTGIGFALMKSVFDISEFSNGGPIGKPGAYAVGMMAFVFVVPPLSLGTLIFAFGVCLSRCQTLKQGFASVLAVVAVVLVLVSEPGISLLFPALFLGKLTHSSVGFYVGAAIQIGLGAALLGWMDRLLANYRFFER